MNSIKVKPELLYINDPMCSWCYGFSPQLSILKTKYDSLLTFKMIEGGLRPGTREVMNDQLKKFLKEHWEEIHSITGQPFKYEILQSNTFIYDTEPACRAVITVRKLKPEVEFEFFKAVQTAFYAENKNTNNILTYEELLPRFNINKEDFKKLFLSQDLKNETQADFALSNSLGVRGFPTLLLKKDNKITILSRGYQKASEIEKIIDRELSK